MDKTRMEAFSDAVIAIVITIMVLEMKVPHHTEWKALIDILPVFLSYVLSFAYLAIYWNNHHHLLKAVDSVDGSVLWANMLLLFFLSLIPFTTGWMGENDFAKNPVILYGINLLLAGKCYNILSNLLINAHGKDSVLAQAIGKDCKGKTSLIIYTLAIIIAFFAPMISCVLYAAVAIMWIVPDPRIEQALKS